MGLARPAQLAALATLVCALLGAAPALATTSVSGAGNPSAPLVIDPKALPSDPLTLRLDTGGTPQVAYIQRMPVTKTVEKVTLGDFEADPSGCSAAPQLRVSVAEHPAGNADVLETLAYSEVNPEPPDTRDRSAGRSTTRSRSAPVTATRSTSGRSAAAGSTRRPGRTTTRR